MSSRASLNQELETNQDIQNVLNLHNQVVEKLKFPTRTVEELEKGNVCFVQYPLNYFFSRQYAYLVGAKFPNHFNMQSFKKRGQ